MTELERVALVGYLVCGFGLSLVGMALILVVPRSGDLSDPVVVGLVILGVAAVALSSVAYRGAVGVVRDSRRHRESRAVVLATIGVVGDTPPPPTAAELGVTSEEFAAALQARARRLALDRHEGDR